jgi:acyl-homoserine lactone acylase PvdQ
MRISVPNRVRGASRIGLHLAIPWLAAASAGPAPRPPASLDVAGLSAPVEILTDRWGVPHIFASTVDDAFFAQGFQAARDQLWQMDLWRKRGLGEMTGEFCMHGSAWAGDGAGLIRELAARLEVGEAVAAR